MKFAVGYQLPNDTGMSFTESVAKYHDRIAEVYFLWLDLKLVVPCKTKVKVMWIGTRRRCSKPTRIQD